MNSYFLKTIILLLFLNLTQNIFGQLSITLSQNAHVSVITCDTGNESYSLFGHTAIRIADFENNLDVVYNYGAFDFRTPNFVTKFAKGDLQYFAVANTFLNFMSQYTYEQRSVFEQELNIPLAIKQKIFDNLNAILASSESNYTYKFIDKNCTSMVVDILNKSLEFNIITKKLDTDKTYRTILFPYFDNFFYEQLGTSIIFGAKVDEYSNHIFLPFELYQSLQQTHYLNHWLCTKSKTLLYFPKQAPISWWNNLYLYLFFLGFTLIINKKYTTFFYLLLMGLLGVFFISVEFYSNHQELKNNYNIMLFNPILLILLFFIIKKNKKWIVNIAVLNMVILGIYMMIMVNKAHLLIVLPMVITSLILLTKLIFQSSKPIPIII